MEMTMTTMTKSRRHAAVKLPPQRNPTAQFQLPAISLILILISVYVSKYIILDCLTLFSDIISNLLVRRQHSSVQTKNQISNVSRPDKNGVFAAATMMMIFVHPLSLSLSRPLTGFHSIWTNLFFLSSCSTILLTTTAALHTLRYTFKFYE